MIRRNHINSQIVKIPQRVELQQLPFAWGHLHLHVHAIASFRLGNFWHFAYGLDQIVMKEAIRPQDDAGWVDVGVFLGQFAGQNHPRARNRAHGKGADGDGQDDQGRAGFEVPEIAQDFAQT
ncbi:MAG: hypothetical protein AAF702_41085 [Chloroflexota bacterium]